MCHCSCHGINIICQCCSNFIVPVGLTKESTLQKFVLTPLLLCADDIKIEDTQRLVTDEDQSDKPEQTEPFVTDEVQSDQSEETEPLVTEFAALLTSFFGCLLFSLHVK